MAPAAVLLALLVTLLYVQHTSQQGLQSDPSAVLRASGSYAALKAIYSQSAAFKRAWSTGAAASTCSKAAGSLCSPYGQTYQQKAAVLIATSPAAFDARSSGSMGSFSAVAQPKDQGICNSCVAFAILAAAQSAMACALKQDASSSMSEQDFFFCKSASPGEERTCSSSWSMKQGVDALVALQLAKRYPVTESCMPWDPTGSSCTYECLTVEPELMQGTFGYVLLQSAWEMQEHIRTWGSVVSRLEVYSDFKPFFANNPAGIYPGHGPTATKVTSHAIQIVGYDLGSNPPSWLCKNSWGTAFAAGGFFRVAFGADGVGNPDDTYGIKFKLFNAPPKPYNRITPAGRGGCYNYRALPTDFVSRVAAVFGTSPSQILLDNKDIIKQPDMLLTDMTIVLCGIAVPAQSAAAPAPAPAPPAAKAPPSAPAVSTKKGPTQQATQQNTAQPQPPKSVSSVQTGTYTGNVKCNGADFGATFIVTPGKTAGTYELDQSTPFSWFTINCDFQMRGTCTSSNQNFCKGGQQPWVCSYHTFVKWTDTCGGIHIDKPTSIKMCYSSGGVFTMVNLDSCQSYSGAVSLTSRRRREH